MLKSSRVYMVALAAVAALLAALLMSLSGDGDGSGVAGNGSTDAAGDGGRIQAAATPSFRLRRVVAGLNDPVWVGAAPGCSGLYIVERPGRIRRFAGGRLSTYLDIRGRVGSSGTEQGLLSVAFHPKFATNRRLFVNYTDRSGDTRIDELKGRCGRAAPSSRRAVMFVNQPFSNHNGGLVMFGPDRRLYIGMGDGGGANDPAGHAQNLRSRLGKLLRINVDGARPYSIPSDNPFAGSTGARREIWAYGLRNPWRFSFDRRNDDLYIGDVGQGEWEEINVNPGNDTKAANYQWDKYEGREIVEQKTIRGRQVGPAFVYSHNDGSCSVTGGHVYRGSRVPSLRGWYLYADYCSSWLRGIRTSGGKVTARFSRRGIGQTSSFGVDGSGELYLTSLGGSVHKVVQG